MGLGDTLPPPINRPPWGWVTPLSPTVLCIFSYPHPLVSRQVGFFANIAFFPTHKMTKFWIYSKRLLLFQQKAVWMTKDRNFCVLPPFCMKPLCQRCYVVVFPLCSLYNFILWGTPFPPDLSLSRNLLPNFPSLFWINRNISEGGVFFFSFKLR